MMKLEISSWTLLIFIMVLDLQHHHRHHLFIQSTYLASFNCSSLVNVLQVINASKAWMINILRINLKNFVSSGAMMSSIVSLLLHYKQNPDQNHKLTNFYGLHIKKSHYESVIIDTKNRFLQMCDSFNNHNYSFTNFVTLISKNDVNHWLLYQQIESRQIFFILIRGYAFCW